MKKIGKILIIFLLLFLMVPVGNVKAETLKEVKAKVAALESKKGENDRLTNEAKANINAKRNAIVKAENTIVANEGKVEDAKAKVAESQEQIKIKTEEMKDVIGILQYTEGNYNNIYLDYLFDASSVSELMEMQYVIEQVIKYTQEQLDDLNKMVKDNEALQVKLANDNVTLNNSITEYEKQLEELEKYIDSLASIGLSYNDQIEAQKGMVKMYEEAGCKDNDDIEDCYFAKMGGSGSFARPLTSGRVTQAWKSSHGAIDLGGNSPGTNVYAPASGTVVYVKLKSSCGGNIIYMHNKVNGQAYTTEYAHLKSVKVSTGQQVTKGQVIGTVGGDSSTWYYDSCTTGTHLHYAISYGYYFSNGKYGNEWSTYKANTKATSVKSISGFTNTKGWTWSTR